MRRFVLVGLALGVLGGLPLLTAMAPRQTQPRETLRLNVFRVYPELAAARAQGLFAAENLEVEITVTPNSTAQMRGLIEGTYDLAYTAFDNVLAWSGRDGATIVAVAQTEGTPSLPVFARPEVGTWEGLRGRPLAVDAVDTAFALVLRRILLAHNLDLDRGDYALVPEGATKERFESLQRGDTFAGILGPPWDARAVEDGLVLLGDQRQVLPNYPGGIVAVNRAWADTHSESIVRFLRAVRAGQSWVAANPDAATSLLATEQNASREVAAAQVQSMTASPDLNLAGLESVIELRTMFGYRLLQGSDLARYIEPRFVRAALGS